MAFSIEKAVTNDTKSVTTWCRRWDLTASLRFAVNGNDLCSPFGEGVQVPSFSFLQTNKKEQAIKIACSFWCRRWDLTASLRFAVNGNDLCSPFGEGVQVPSFSFLQTNKKEQAIKIACSFWCRRWDLNPHELTFTGF